MRERREHRCAELLFLKLNGVHKITFDDFVDVDNFRLQTTKYSNWNNLSISLQNISFQKRFLFKTKLPSAAKQNVFASLTCVYLKSIRTRNKSQNSVKLNCPCSMTHGHRLLSQLQPCLLLLHPRSLQFIVHLKNMYIWINVKPEST